MLKIAHSLIVKKLEDKIANWIHFVFVAFICLLIFHGCRKETPKEMPTVSLVQVSNITSSSATSEGAVSTDGGASVTAKGVCWSTSQNPTVSDNKTSDGTGTGSFSSSISGLAPGATYYIRAYATNSIGTAYSSSTSFTLPALAPALTTSPTSEVTATSLISGGNIVNDGGSPITARGVCWSTNSNPTTADNKTTDGGGIGAFSSSVIGLTPGTTYYIRSYATNAVGTAYGDVISIAALKEESLRDCLQAFPGVKGEDVPTTLNGNPITCSGINGLLIYQGDIIISPANKAASLDDKRLRWTDNTIFYSVNDNFPNKDRIDASFKEFEKTNILFKQRTSESNYIEFKYIKDAGCYSYIGMIGGEQDIVIDNWGNPADVAHEIGHALGLLHEQSKSSRDQYVDIITANIVPGMVHNFQIFNNSVNTSGFDFNSLMLYDSYAFSIQYGVKPTITKKDGSVFRPQRLHFTDTDISLINQLYPSIPDIFTTALTSVTTSGALGGGNIVSDKGSAVMTRGICWGSSQNPTTSNSKTSDGSGTGSFTSSLSGLTANTTYYVRAYATNSVGTAYGNQVSFTTSQMLSLPTLTSSDISNITQTNASTGGNISSDGNAPITARGICWGTSQNPTTANSKTSDGSGTGSFTSSLSGLTANTTYYVRAYATNSVGTAYGNQVSFTTSSRTADTGSVTDIEGNVYKTITIGTQIWMAENLKTTKYNDGTSIPNVTDEATWAALTTGAYCWYNNNTSQKATYGALYNLYSVNTGKLCPTGWHVPTDAEWTTLTTLLGGESVAGTKMKTTTGWYSNGSNSSGFSGLPGGYRLNNGAFTNFGADGDWWSSTQNATNYAWYRSLYYSSEDTYRGYNYIGSGFSIRCLGN